MVTLAMITPPALANKFLTVLAMLASVGLTFLKCPVPSFWN